MQKGKRDFHLAISSGRVYTVNKSFTLGFQFSASNVTGRYELPVDLDVFLGRLRLEEAKIQASKKPEKR